MDLNELIETSGQNAEDKGFHDTGNLQRQILRELDKGTTKEGGVLLLGETAIVIPEKFWREIYVHYQSSRQFLIVSEVVEALDEVRNGRPSYYEVDGKPEGTGTELGDTVIRIADYAFEFNEPVVESIEKKAAYNKTRERMHGGKLS